MNSILKIRMAGSVLFMVLLVISLTRCGGGGGGTPPSPAHLIVSGTVQAPNGQVAFSPRQDLFEKFLNRFAPLANASVSGISPVPDGTKVELVRIDDAGIVVATLAMTTTSGGSYSFDLTELGLSFSPDLMLQVVNQNTGTQMRAFVTAERVNIDPISETAVRLLLEQIAMTPGTTLSHFTPQEINDVVASIDLLTTVNQSAAGIDIEETVATITDLVTADAGLMAFIASASEIGQTTQGPGDIGDFFPFTQGNTWRYEGTLSENGGLAVSFFNTVSITGSKEVDGVTTTVFRETNPGNSGVAEEDYYLKDSRGITYWGNDDATDVLTPQLIPYQEVIFPLRPDSTFEQVKRTGLDCGEDLDGDGINETVDVNSQVNFAAFEEVIVLVGSFANSIKIRVEVMIAITLSHDNTKVTGTGTTTQWFAPGLGLVKSISITQYQYPGKSFSETVTQELVGLIVNGQGKGILPQFTIASGVTNADSDTERPGISAIGFDGTNYLLVSCRDISLPMGIFGVTISDRGEVLNTFHIAEHDCQFCRPSVSFDGSNYLVVFQYQGQILGIRVSPTGTVLDGPSGFPISSGTPFSITNWDPAVAFDGVNYFVVWNKYINNTHDIYGARVTPDGQVLDEFTVFSAPGEQVGASVAYDGNNYLVAWRDTRSGSGPAEDTDIYGTRVSPEGIVLDTEGISISTAPGYQGDPNVIFGGSNYFVVWNDVPNIGGVYGQVNIFGTRITPGGNLLDGPSETGGIAINTAPYPKSHPTVVFDGTGYLVAWVVGTYSNQPPAGIFAARISTDGILIDGPSDALGISISGPPPDYSKLVHTSILFNGENSLLSWVINSELSGTTKDIAGALIFPF